MIKNKVTIGIVSISTGALLLVSIVALPASAQTDVGVNASASVSASSSLSARAQANLATRLGKIKTDSDAAIDARITALNNLATRIQAMKNISASEKTTIASEVQTNISGLSSLKTKIDADTDVTTAGTDAKTITGSYRIYALVIPQGYIAASGDRVDTITGMMTTISAKLQTRITADQTAGKNVASLQTSLTDLNAKIADASSQASIAQSGVANLTPDQGDTTKAQANHTALVAARANIKTATSDLVTARQDAKTIIADLKSLDAKASGSASASTTVQQ